MEALRATDPTTVGGRYRLLGRLGSGGMGVVYLGRSPGGRLVAVKCVHRELAADPEFRRRFAHELEAVRRVGGFHTAQVVDADPDGDPPWLVTAYVPGPSLAEAVAAHGPLPEASLRVLGAGLAEALDAIHAVGLIHRDLKPSNVLLADDGPRVIDFGIARALDGTAITRTQVVVGTPGYMAPEQIAGGAIGPACDVFSLGHVLCHAAGCAPFGRGGAQVMLYRVMHTEPDLGGVPQALRPAIAACLARDPADRPTPAELLDLFGPAAHDAPAGAWLPAQRRAAPVVAGIPGDAPPVGPPPLGPPNGPPNEPNEPNDRTRTAITEVQQAPDAPPPGGGKRRLRWLPVPLALVLVAAAVCVRLFVITGGSGPPDCFPSGGTPAGSSPPTRVTSVPAGTPHPPAPTGPADRTVIELGQSVTLSWDHAAAASRVFTGLGDDAPRYTAWLSTAACTFTPTATGLYRWEASTANAAEGQAGSAWSEDRFLFVRAKSSSTPDPGQDAPAVPRLLAPADQAVAKAGQPVSLSWTANGFASHPSVLSPDGTWQNMPWQDASTYLYTPPSPGIYVWSAFTEAKGGCDGGACASGASAQRYLIVE
ncbi:serine/threonine-protein kinase [Kitasatospora sp. NPDC086801]|uniref:serine/threonine-protein kinase n=1 Tax=Kitasatospora sp. NPDC086801 TaxID=3364066 RepID=UPI00380B712D